MMTSNTRTLKLAGYMPATLEFQDLYNQYAALVRRILSRLVHANDLDDAVQETFVKIYFALPKFEGQCQLDTWIYRIAINCAKDFHRKNYTLDKIKKVFSNFAFLSKDRGNTADRDDCNFYLNRIPLKHRTVALLFYLEEKSIPEIAEIFKIPEGTVKSRLHVARKLLNALITEEKNEF